MGLCARVYVCDGFADSLISVHAESVPALECRSSTPDGNAMLAKALHADSGRGGGGSGGGPGDIFAGMNMEFKEVRRFDCYVYDCLQYSSVHAPFETIQLCTRLFRNHITTNMPYMLTHLQHPFVSLLIV